MSKHHWQDDRLTLYLYVKPGAKKTGWMGIYDDRIKIQIAATPTKGKANKLLVRFVADFFGVTTKAVKLEKGDASQQKVIVITTKDKKEQVRKIFTTLLRDLSA